MGDNLTIRFVKVVYKSNAQCTEGVAVVTLVHADERSFFRATDVVPVLDGNFEGVFYGAGTVARKYDVAVGRWHEVGEGFGEFDNMGVGHAAGARVLEGAGLLLNRLNDLRVVVTESTGPPAGDNINIAIALVVEEIDAFAPYDMRKVTGLDGGEGGVRVKEVAHGRIFSRISWVNVCIAAGSFEKGLGLGVSSSGI